MPTPFQIEPTIVSRLADAQALAQKAADTAHAVLAGHHFLAAEMHRHVQRLCTVLHPIVEALAPVAEISTTVVMRAPDRWRNKAEGQTAIEWSDRAEMILSLCRACLRLSPTASTESVLSACMPFAETLPTLPANLHALAAELMAEQETAFDAAEQRLRAAGRLGQCGTA